MHIFIEIFKALGVLTLCCEMLCSMVGIAYLFDYMLSNSSQNKHSRQLRELESDEFFDKVWEDCAKHGPMNLEDYDKFKH